MRIVLCCDVDPVFPADLREPPAGDVWTCLDRVSELAEHLGTALPPVTWMIRADATVRFATGDYASGYLSRRGLWDGLLGRGHELGWHMHVLSARPEGPGFAYDPRPAWLEEALGSLRAHVDVRATRTGWDYGDNWLLRELDRLGIRIDLSALPGQWVRYVVSGSRVVVDWRRAPTEPYYPSASDYQRPGVDALELLELPVTVHRNGPWRALRRLARLSVAGRLPVGLRNRTSLLTERWEELPAPAPYAVFYFHPEDLANGGAERLTTNLHRLRAEPRARFLTASEAWEALRSGPGAA